MQRQQKKDVFIDSGGGWEIGSECARVCVHKEGDTYLARGRGAQTFLRSIQFVQPPPIRFLFDSTAETMGQSPLGTVHCMYMLEETAGAAHGLLVEGCDMRERPWTKHGGHLGGPGVSVRAC
jgi:hypothetical protein